MSDYKKYLDFTKQREGGLSKAKTDSASKYPVPDGSGYHTNKGVTWTTFKRLSSILGYTAEPILFYSMPDTIFNAIAKYYWDTSKANLIENQAIANLIFQSMWGGGYDRIVKDIQKYLGIKEDGKLGNITASLINGFHSKRELYDFAHQARLNYLRSISAYKANGKGWEARMKKLYNHNKQYL